MNLNVLEPFPRLETDRLTLRQLTVKDAVAVMTIFGDPAVTKTTDIDPFTRIEEAIGLIEALDRRYRAKEAIRWGIFLKAGDALISTGGFNYFDTNSQRSEIGYDIARAHWGQGFVTEAGQAILDFGFNQIGLNRVEATTNLHNIASIKVLYKLGFREEGILYQYGYWRGSFHDLRMFSRLRQDWPVS